jgi:fatty acid desaturase
MQNQEPNLTDSSGSSTEPADFSTGARPQGVDEQIYRIPKFSLRNRSGQSYIDFKRQLVPRYSRVWRDITLGYVALAAGVIGLMAIPRTPLWLTVLSILLGALFFGFVLAYLNLFFHEAAHWNLARSRSRNDFLADLFIGSFFGQSIEAYRIVHFGHHQHHGTPTDSEHSYFDPINLRFLSGALLGVKAFQVAREREGLSAANGQFPKSASRKALGRGLLLNGLIVGASVATGHWALALAWCAGVLSVFPFFNAVRQALEHRDELANDNANYAQIAHGRINRLFGDSLLAQTLGGAGFNRHLLHHWEPQISYTRLAELETYAMDTEYADLFRSRQTTYTRTFFQLLRLGS